jgi:hypothetical protein
MPFASGLTGGGKPNLDASKNFLTFTGSGSTTAPPWANKLDYLIVGGGGTGVAGTYGSGGMPGGTGGQVLQGSVAIAGNVTITVGVGGAGAASSVAIAGGSTFTAAAVAGAGSNQAGTLPSAPFNVRTLGGGGASGGGSGTIGGGGRGGFYYEDWLPPGPTWSARFSSPAATGWANTGGGGGGGVGGAAGNAGPAGGGSGIVYLYFS